MQDCLAIWSIPRTLGRARTDLEMWIQASVLVVETKRIKNLP